MTMGGQNKRYQIFTGGEICTNNPAQPFAAAVCVADGVIRDVGTLKDVRKQVRGPAEIIDIDGAFMLPGLIDSHGHTALYGETLNTLDLSTVTDLDELLQKVVEASETSDEWIVGHNWDHNHWSTNNMPDGRPLERALPGRPVWLKRVDTHAALASPTALARAGITRETKDPSGGIIVRDPRSGEPTGLLIDRAMELVEVAMPPLTAKTVRAQISTAMYNLSRFGLTAVHDMSVTAIQLDVLRELDRLGKLPLRVYAVLADNDALRKHWFERGPHYGRKLTVRAAKFFADGTAGSRSAALLEPYADDSKNQGLLIYKEAELREQIIATDKAGFQPVVHAIGDRAIRLVLDIFGKEILHNRPRIEHAQIVHENDLRRFGVCNAIASMQPQQAVDDIDWLVGALGAERAASAYPWRKFHELGTTVTFGSDFPIATPDPLAGMHAALTYGIKTGGEYPKFSFSDTLRAYTTSAAYAGFAEDSAGQISPGRSADFTLMRGDLHGLLTGKSADPTPLIAAHVVMTVVGGEIIYEV